MISFAHPDQLEIAAEVAQSFTLDNGAFSVWKAGKTLDVKGYYEWVIKWHRHPGFDWAIIPDIIDGTEEDNNALIDAWPEQLSWRGVPVWHLHESIDRLRWLVDDFPIVALGSSGAYSEPGQGQWWQRMATAMDAACDADGRPKAKLHGLRMLNPTIFSQLPLSSADSTNVARNVGLDSRWNGTYTPRSARVRATVLIDRIEHHGSAAQWKNTMGTQCNFQLIG